MKSKGILDAFRLDGRSAIVTGAARGLGQAIAAGLAEAGAHLTLVDILPVDQTRDLVQGLGRKAVGVKADLSSLACIGSITETAVQSFGGIDILFNNAGIIRRSPIQEFSEKDWDDVADINLKTLFFLSQAVAKIMIRQGRGGKIVNTASLLSFQGGILVPSYTASKSGVMGLTRAMANELAPHGINVNAIAPGYMATDNTAVLRTDAARNKAILDRIPAGRWGEPDDLKGAAVFLASDASSYMNGYTVAVDGGWLAR